MNTDKLHNQKKQRISKQNYKHRHIIFLSLTSPKTLIDQKYKYQNKRDRKAKKNLDFQGLNIRGL